MKTDVGTTRYGWWGRGGKVWGGRRRDGGGGYKKGR